MRVGSYIYIHLATLLVFLTIIKGGRPAANHIVLHCSFGLQPLSVRLLPEMLYLLSLPLCFHPLFEWFCSADDGGSRCLRCTCGSAKRR